MQHRTLTKMKLASYLAIVFLMFPKYVLAGDYQDGLQAYIDGDFVLAQQCWLKAANAKDAKSMFNLGLLHEQNKLENSSLDKALNWYRLAADNGYAAAGYHQAQRMLERGGSDDDAIALIRDSANSGYLPARRYLGLASELSVQQHETELVSPEPSKNSRPIAATTTNPGVIAKSQSVSWINRQRSENWTIQLLAFKSEEQVLRFISEHSLEDKVAYFSEMKQGDVFYKLVYGSYDSKDKATFVRQNLSRALQEHGPWLRTWSSIQKITKP